MILSGCVGPRGDAYADLGPASSDEAFAYHTPQVEVLAGSGVDLVTALTLTNVAEAIGFVRAASEHSIPAVVSFTVETDGRLPSGMDLADAIETVDAETDGAAEYFMINCAHPDHFAPVLASDSPHLGRVRGIRANASRLSHAELDESTELDDGDPTEFGAQLAASDSRRTDLRARRMLRHRCAPYRRDRRSPPSRLSRRGWRRVGQRVRIFRWTLVTTRSPTPTARISALIARSIS